MIFKSLELINFRNYERQSLRFEQGLNIIVGDNAQGKTNIIEALVVCATGKSHRTSRDVDMVKIGQKNFFIRLHCTRQQKQTNIEIFYETGKGKSIRVNGNNLNRIGQLMGSVYCVVFSPEDLLMIKEGPSQRRRFIDVFLSQIKPMYFYNMQQYIKTLKQKNALLKQNISEKDLSQTFDIWNEKLAEMGTEIMAMRADFIQKIAQEASKIHLNISDGKEELNLKYKPSFAVNIDKNISKTEINKYYISNLEKIRQREIMLKTCLLGPQKDDIDIEINGINIKQYGSQGQQRSAALSMKMAELEVFRQITGEEPVLLLDDVLSELDSGRKELLIKGSLGSQTLITTSEMDILNIDTEEKSNIIRVREGRIY